MTITFVVFKIFTSMLRPTRMGIFWIIILFISINLIGSTFSLMGNKRRLNHYQLYDPVEYLLAKLITNFIKLLIAGALLLGLFVLFSHSPLQDIVLFSKLYILAALGLVAVLTFVSSLAVYGTNQASMVTILALPLLIPVLIIGMRVSLISEGEFFDSATGSNLLMLLGIDLIMIVMSILFISFTWKP